jgi:hypothetical protein
MVHVEDSQFFRQGREPMTADKGYVDIQACRRRKKDE